MATKFLDYTGLSYLWNKIKEWCSSIFVTKATDETITGIKTFKSNLPRIIIRNPNLTRGIVPSNNVFTSLLFCDTEATTDIANTNHGRTGCIESGVWSTGRTEVGMYVYDNNKVVNGAFGIVAEIDADGIPVGRAPSTSENRNIGADIVTRDWIPKDTRIVHTTGNETIAGSKILTNALLFKSDSPNIIFYNTGLTKGTNPSGYIWNEFLFCDKFEDSSDKHRIGGVSTYVDSNGTTSIQLRVHNWVADSTDFGVLGIYYPKNGTPYTIAPTPATADDSTKIATTAFVKAQNYIVNSSNVHHVIQSGTWHAFIHKRTDISRSIAGNYGWIGYGQIQDKDGNTLVSTDLLLGATYADLYTSVTFLSSSHPSFNMILAISSDGTGNLRIDTDNKCALGTSARRWTQLFAATSTIGTSDKRLKNSIDAIPEEILNVWEHINWKQFRFNDAVKEKGIESARLHTGIIAQDVEEIFKEYNLDPNKYGFFCYDFIEAEEELRRPDGELVHEASEARDIYSIRYEEALCIEAAYQRRKNKILENRISELEKRLAKLEGII